MKNSIHTKSDISTQQEKWDRIFDNSVDEETITLEYLTDQIKFNFLVEHNEAFSNEYVKRAVSIVVTSLMTTSVEHIGKMLKACAYLKRIEKSNIPQFSNFATAVICVPEVLLEVSAPVTCKELGYLLYSESKSDLAAEKFGENHGKLAAFLDLAAIKKEDGHKKFFSSALTAPFCHMEQREKMELLTRLCYRIPFVQHAVISENPEEATIVFLQEVLAPTTYKRRISNAQEVLAFALQR